MNDKKLTEAELAERWNISLSTLRKMRREGRTPHSFRAGYLIRYSLQVVEEYERTNDRS